MPPTRLDRRPAYRILKRSLDLVAAVAILAITSPLYLLVWLLIRWRLGTPVLFRQERTGGHGRPFTLMKFRTMRDAADATGRPLPDELRLTQLGRWLRLTSLDELPQLWNVIRGDMSLVGPRPLLRCYLDRYTPAQRRRHEVLPGVTGWAQVHGRNRLSWEEKFDYDVWYVDHASFGLDLLILLKTFWITVVPRGISAEEHATMPEFQGTSPDPQTPATRPAAEPAAKL